jgi:hypothetical protein
MTAIKTKAKPQIIIIIIIIIDILKSIFSLSLRIIPQFSSLCNAKGVEVTVTSLAPT